LFIGAVFILLALVLVFTIRHTAEDGSMPAASPSDGSTAAQSPSAPNTGSRPPRESPRAADRLLKTESAKTDITLSSFPIKEYQHLAPPAGKAAAAVQGEAYIHVPSSRRRIAMEPNQIGEFPAVETKLNDTVGVRLSLDTVKPGTPVRVVIMDGGSFPAIEGVVQVLKVTKWGGVAFEFATSANIGFHRILVQAQGQPSRILNFSAHDGDTWPAPSTASTN
jgi:hypothetical protein